MTVGELFVLFGLKVDKKSWKQGTDAIGGLKRAAVGLGAYFGIKGLGKAMIGFNSSMEEAKIQIAAMLALSKKTNMSDEVKNADMLYQNLQKRAAELPGTTEDYVKMLAAIAQPVTAAGLSLKELEDITVATVVAAKPLGVTWQNAATDLDQFLNGNMGIRDRYTGKLMKNMGIITAADRKRVKAMTMNERGALLVAASNQKQIGQMADAQSKSFEGVFGQLKDEVQRFLGTVGKGLFDALKTKMTALNKWLKDNKEEVKAFATEIGAKIAGAFTAIVDAFTWLYENKDTVSAVLLALGGVITYFSINAAIAWLAAFWPVILAVAIIAAVIIIVRKLIAYAPKIREALGGAWDWVKEKAQGFADWVTSIPGKIQNAINEAADYIKRVLGEAWDYVIMQANAAFEAMKGNTVIRTLGKLGGAGNVMDMYDRAKQDLANIRAGGGQTANAPTTANVSVGTATGSGSAGANVTVGPTTIEIKVGNVNDAKKARDSFADEQQLQRRHAMDTYGGSP